MKQSKLEKLVLELSQHCRKTDECRNCPLCLGGVCALRVSTPANALAGLVMKPTEGKLWIRCKNQSEVSEIRDLLKDVNTDELVHTARSSSACFPVFQCTLSAAQCTYMDQSYNEDGTHACDYYLQEVR